MRCVNLRETNRPGERVTAPQVVCSPIYDSPHTYTITQLLGDAEELSTKPLKRRKTNVSQIGTNSPPVPCPLSLLSSHLIQGSVAFCDYPHVMPCPEHYTLRAIKLFALCLFVVFLLSGVNLEANVGKVKLPSLFSSQIRLEAANSEDLEWPTSFNSDFYCHMQTGAQVGMQVWFPVQVTQSNQRIAMCQVNRLHTSKCHSQGGHSSGYCRAH